MKNCYFLKIAAAGMLKVLSISIVVGQLAIDCPAVNPYRFERINEHNFHSQGWREQEVNLIQGQQQFLDESDHLKIVCGPPDESDPRLIKGAVTMNLPTSMFPTLRRIRLRRGGYSGTFLADLTELKYSTYLVHGGPAALVLQVDVNGDETKDFNIFYAPEEQGEDNSVVFDIWQRWDTLDGHWGIESAIISGLPAKATIDELIALHPNARIIDTEPIGHNGEGVRFTVGPPAFYPNNVSYLDALTLGTADQNHSTMFDFTCDASEQ